MRRYRWFYVFDIRFQLDMNLNLWALPFGVNFGADYSYPGGPEKLLDYRWFGINVGPFGLTVFWDHDLDRDESDEETISQPGIDSPLPTTNMTLATDHSSEAHPADEAL
ncbi:MAG: hypothetical protein GEU73_05090 [Chloroflexi bacterium]|nr:hypothetical protein [Chloroflexota bacterium]